ncbi:MAG: hypothetical protein HY908_02905 [Myxococcales bacterium]|nr:hypothetical protein [Myxococcales bacterium]
MGRRRDGWGGRWVALGGALACLAGCGASEVKPTAESHSGGLGSTSPAPAGGPSAPAASPSASGAPTGEALPASAQGESCGELGCRVFDTPQQALARVLAERPLILGVGESHMQKGSEGVRSATSHFRDELLSRLAPLASDLVLELWVVDPSCRKTQQGQKAVEKVAEKQKEVTKSQSAGNQNEFVALGNKAKALGVVPHTLSPSCAEYDAIVKAKTPEDSIAAMLGMLTTLTSDKAQRLHKRNADAGVGKMIVTYGGAMHNDLVPPQARAEWSFGADLQKASDGHYVELDIIVPELVKDSPSWRELPWYRLFDRTKHPGKTTLFNPSPGSYVLVFPAGGVADAPAGSGSASAPAAPASAP